MSTDVHSLAGHNGLPGGTWDTERHDQLVDNLAHAFFAYVADYGRMPSADDVTTMRNTQLDALKTPEEVGTQKVDTSPLAAFAPAQIQSLLNLLKAQDTGE
jgi:hypothetical protein